MVSRDRLIDDMASRIVDDMDQKTLVQLGYEVIVENLGDLPDEDLAAQAEELGFDLFDYEVGG